MLDWLRRDPRAQPTVEIAGRSVPVEVRRLERARRMTMRLAPDGSAIRITMPRWGRTGEAIDFARTRRDWLERQLAAVHPPIAVTAGTPIPFRGGLIVVHHVPNARRTPQLGDGVLSLGGAESSLGPRVHRWLRCEMLTLLASDLACYCARAQLPISPLALSNARRRWGSCAANGAIRINWRLVMAPDFVRRSVVAHEVAHLVHFDHSPAFHACLAQIYEGEVANANAWLKQEGQSLYRLFG